MTLLGALLLAACTTSTPTAQSQPGAGAPAVGGAPAGSSPGGTPASGGTSNTLAVVPGGPVSLGGVTNPRRVGQLVTPEGKRLRSGVLLRSGELSGVNCDDLSALGVQSVIDLRDLEHAQYVANASCVADTTRFHEADIPRILPPSASTYLETLVATEPKLGALFGHLAAENAFPALIHCVIGRDRASLVTALVLLSVGIPRDQVIEDMTTNQDSGIVIEAAWMDEVFSRIDDAGGIGPYLEANGVEIAHLDAIGGQVFE